VIASSCVYVCVCIYIVIYTNMYMGKFEVDLEEDGEAHLEGVGGEEGLLAADHEGPRAQVLARWSHLGHLRRRTRKRGRQREAEGQGVKGEAT
jgi:hypothetical protein